MKCYILKFYKILKEFLLYYYTLRITFLFFLFHIILQLFFTLCYFSDIADTFIKSEIATPWKKARNHMTTRRVTGTIDTEVFTNN